jgi:membrane-associated protease RseP (regulator of RpoE activity)
MTFVLALIGGGLAALLVHELGHLVAARCYGVRVVSLNLGVGPKIGSLIDRSGTQWNFGMIPSLAYVMLYDEEDFLNPSTSQSLSSKSLAQRAIVYAAGPLSNFLFAFVLLGISLAVFGEIGLPETPVVQFAGVALSLIAGFSLLLGCFQLIPIPPLDGGLLALVAAEALGGKATSNRIRARLRSAGMVTGFVAEPLIVVICLIVIVVAM